MALRLHRIHPEASRAQLPPPASLPRLPSRVPRAAPAAPEFSSSRTASSAREKGLLGCGLGFALARRVAALTGRVLGAGGTGKVPCRRAFCSFCSCFLVTIQPPVCPRWGGRCFQRGSWRRDGPQGGEQQEGEGGPGRPAQGWNAADPGTGVSPLLCSEAPPRKDASKAEPGPSRRRCHPSCFCFSAGRCLGSSGVRMLT